MDNHSRALRSNQRGKDWVINVILIPNDQELNLLPSWKRGVKGHIVVRCGNEACGQKSILRDPDNAPVRKDGTHGHVIGGEGTVTPSILCPHCGDGWHVWGKLLGWAKPK